MIDGMRSSELRELESHLQCSLASLCQSAYSDTIVNIQLVEVTPASAKKPATLLAYKASSDGASRIPFWGRIVTESVAKLLGKTSTMPITPVPVKDGLVGPPLFIDGTNYMNHGRSDFCVAWLIKPVPTKKSDQTEDGAPVKTFYLIV
jgi:hypothetical protein